MYTVKGKYAKIQMGVEHGYKYLPEKVKRKRRQGTKKYDKYVC